MVPVVAILPTPGAGKNACDCMRDNAKYLADLYAVQTIGAQLEDFPNVGLRKASVPVVSAGWRPVAEHIKAMPGILRWSDIFEVVHSCVLSVSILVIDLLARRRRSEKCLGNEAVDVNRFSLAIREHDRRIPNNKVLRKVVPDVPSSASHVRTDHHHAPERRDGIATIVTKHWSPNFLHESSPHLCQQDSILRGNCYG